MYLLATRVTSAAVTLFDAGFVFFEDVGRVAVEGEGHLLVESLVGRVVVEDEGVEDLVLGLAEFGGRGWVGLETVDLCEHGLGCGDGGCALGCSEDVEDSGVVVRGAEAAADAVGEAEFGADVLDDARAEAAGEDLVHDAERVVVGVAALGAEADDDDVGLVDVGLFDEVDAGLRVGEGGLSRTRISRRAGAGSKAARSLASMAAQSKSPETATIMLLGTTVLSCQALRSSRVMASTVAYSGWRA